MANDRRSGQERRFAVHQLKDGSERRGGADRRGHSSKLCPYCSVSLSLAATDCPACKRKVGDVDKNGMAKKPANYWAYVACLLAWVGFYLYIQWAFF
ncbi:MAG: hypothetical protein V3S89_07870 [Desulfobacterales bacterium]